MGNKTGFDSLHPALQNHLKEKLKFKNATEIQELALPQIGSANLSRDIVLQSQTGSGKTLAYLLPIVEQIISTPEEIQVELDRGIGILGMVIVPTRELARQIYDNLVALLNMTLTSNETGFKPKHWIVPGLLIGGEKRKAEKSKLRKGITILISTPGRLLDHLQNTESFIADQCRWLVLDEADKLLELGFEDKVVEILNVLRSKSVLERQPRPQHCVDTPFWPQSLRIIMCSATMQSRLKKLADFNMRNPLYLRSQKNSDGNSEQVQVPTQLKQYYCLVPAKQRLVSLIALLKYISDFFPNSKSIVFFSCIDSAEFHYQALTSQRGLVEADLKENATESSEQKNTDLKVDPKETPNVHNMQSKTSMDGSVGLPLHFFGVPIYLLHGSLNPLVRSETFKKFSSAAGGILLTTDVSSRGLDLPNVDFVIQFDAPTHVNEYIHRIGRTARVDAPGVAIAMLLPEETQYVALLREANDLHLEELRASLESTKGTLGMQSPVELTPEKVYQRMAAVMERPVCFDALEYLLMHTPSIAFGFKYMDSYRDASVRPPQLQWKTKTLSYEVLATDIQMRIERLLESSAAKQEDSSEPSLADLAKKSFLSHIRAYATHPSSEKHIFYIKRLHLGHLAKAFALRETPSQIRDWQTSSRKDAGKPGYIDFSKDNTDSASVKKRRVSGTVRPEDRFFKAAKLKTSRSQMADEFGSGDVINTSNSSSTLKRAGKRMRKF